MKKSLNYIVIISILIAFSLVVLLSCGGERAVADAVPEADGGPYVASELSNKRIHAIAQDADGYIWFGTFRGLNRFNAHEYYQYFSTDSETSLCDNQITDLYSDSKGRLWVATVSGINRYTDSDNFVTVPFAGENNYTSQIFESDDGRIYALSTNRLGRYNPDTDAFDLCVTESTAMFYPFSFVRGFVGLRGRLWVIFNNTVYVYEKDTYKLWKKFDLNTLIYDAHMSPKKTSLWLATKDGLKIIDADKGVVADDLYPQIQHTRLASMSVSLLHNYDGNSLLINTPEKGMYRFDFTTETLTHQDDDGFPFDVPDFIIHTLFTDRQNNLWIGSYDQGFEMRSTEKERFNNNHYLISQLENKSVYAVDSDPHGCLWIATLADGLFVYDHDQARLINAADISSRSFSGVSSVLATDHNEVWLCEILNHRVSQCRYADGRLTVVHEYPIVAPQAIAQDHLGNVWVSTGSGEVVCFAADGQGERRVRPALHSANFISGIAQGADSTMWIAQFNEGMAQISSPAMEVTAKKLAKDTWNEYFRNAKFVPTDMCFDTFGQLWLGTVGSGLLNYDLKGDTLRRCPGLSCTDVAAIEEDRQGNMWISTQYGLCYYDRSIDSISAYYTADGTGGNQYYDRSSCMMPDGTLVFGGTHGLTIFDPIDVYKKRRVPLVFEDLKVHNRYIRPSHNPEVIESRLATTPDIHLSHQQNGFSISFAALDYNKNASTHYYYKLEGHDKYWVDARNNHEVYFANLHPGDYTLRVKITNNNNSIEGAERAIRVHIAPAPWLSCWALTLYAIALVGLVVLIVSLRMHYLRQVRRREQAEHDRQQEQHLNTMNMRFFANISHEFRTPLTMIAGPIAQLQQSANISSDERRLVAVTQRNVTRMLRLVNQMMDFNNLEDDTLKLQVEHVDVITYLNHMAEIFSVNAREKGLTFKVTGLEDAYTTWVDVDKIEKIISNLLSNAIKFTKSGGTVEMTFDVVGNADALALAATGGCALTAPGSYIKLQVSDTGVGIPADSLDKIFDRYYRIQATSATAIGTGIGLYYARALANLHNGCLFAQNRSADEGQTGSIFTLLLPTSEEAYDARCRVTAMEKTIFASSLPVDLTDLPTDDDHDKYTLLIVDDDTDVINYLRALLSPKYNIISCFDAEHAYEQAVEHQPDLVISDVLMPGTSGFDLCRRLKDNLQLCHIPVILVTAMASGQNQVEGLNTGADAYVTKPFDPKYLLALIQSQINNRLRVRSIINSATATNTIEKDVLSGTDMAFMDQLYQLMENELSNNELDITTFCDHLHISRTKLYYKIKGLTGVTPASFFKTYKLNRAAELIAEGKYNISEIADMTGFSTLAHFSTSFKKHFGKAPSAYTPNQ